MRVLVAVLAAAALIAAAIFTWNSSSAKAPRVWPAGTVLAVDELPLSAEEIDRESVFIERIEPGASEAQLRRLALTNIVLPRALSRLMAPAERDAARQRAEEALAQLSGGDAIGPPKPDGSVGELISGGWPELGIVAWGVAMDLEDGQWSGVIEEVGRYFIVRRLKRSDGPMPIATRVDVDILAFPWLPTEDLRVRVERAHDEHRLTIVDPAWSAIVPELIQYRMGVHRK